MLYWTSVVAVALVSSVIHYVSWIMSFSNLSLLPSAVRYRIWCRRSAGNRRHRVRLNSDPAGVNSACFYPEGGCELWGQALFGSLLWRRTILLGRGWRWETGSWKQKVSPILWLLLLSFHIWLISCSDFAYFHYSTVFHLHSEDKCLQKSILLDMVS